MKPPRVVAIIQARMSSSRLPGKVLLDLVGQPMLARVIQRSRRAEKINNILVATTTDSSDDPIVDLCQSRGWSVSRGSLHDVLDRYYHAAKSAGADVIVRITADCPVIDPAVIDKTVNAFLIAANDVGSDGVISFAANRLPPPWGRRYPVGLDVEVCSFTGLEQAWKEASLPHQREHVMPFFYDQPHRFNIILVNPEVDGDFGTLRWTVDTTEDLDLLRRIYSHFRGRDDFSWLDVLTLYQSQPDLWQINARVKPKHYKTVDERYHKK